MYRESSKSEYSPHGIVEMFGNATTTSNGGRQWGKTDADHYV